jgi:hypothetical protein
MTIEITLLPFSCRTFNKVKKFLVALLANVFVWITLIFGIVILLFPQCFPNNGILPVEVVIFLDRMGGVCFTIGALILMTIMYDIKINLCRKEK